MEEFTVAGGSGGTAFTDEYVSISEIPERIILQNEELKRYPLCSAFLKSFYPVVIVGFINKFQRNAQRIFKLLFGQL